MSKRKSSGTSASPRLRVYAAAVLVVLSLGTISRVEDRPSSAGGPAVRDTWSDTWVATDSLGRKLPTYDEVGPPRKDRYVGIFYFLWHGAHVNDSWRGPYDIAKILGKDPEAIRKKESPLWGPIGAPHHWGESLFGYYLSDDVYVLRKHAQMLSDAGVDTLIFDVSNENTYRPYYMKLLRVFSEIRQEGGKTPQVAFLTPFTEPGKIIKELYHNLYEPGLYRDLWFPWHGKPLILADPKRIEPGELFGQQNTAVRLQPGHTLGQSFTTTAAFDAVGGRFPTWAERATAMTLSLYSEGPIGKLIASRRFRNIEDNAWLSVEVDQPLTPGRYYLEMSEPQGTIGWWSHTEDLFPRGEAYEDGARGRGDRTLRLGVVTKERDRIRSFFTFRKTEADYFKGPTGSDMWGWLEAYPQHVFRNSKGEKEQMSVGVAQNVIDDHVGAMSEPGARGRSYHRGGFPRHPDAVLHGHNAAEQWERALKEDPKFLFITGWNEWFAGRLDRFPGVRTPVIFVDAFDQEHSRDIEPMKGGHGDLYYYQMVAFIRRFKGVRQPPAASPPRSIDLDDFRPWKEVLPEFRDDAGDRAWRDHPGYNNVTRYVNKTGRNDFMAAKVTYDKEYVYFYVRTRDPISPYEDPHWMMLFIDTKGDHRVGWAGYNFVINRSVRDATTTLLEESKGGWNWRRKAEVRYRMKGNELALAVRRADLGVDDPHRPIQLDFKWADNIQKQDVIDEFTLNGDSAPNGRFNYRYQGVR